MAACITQIEHKTLAGNTRDDKGVVQNRGGEGGSTTQWSGYHGQKLKEGNLADWLLAVSIISFLNCFWLSLCHVSTPEKSTLFSQGSQLVQMVTTLYCTGTVWLGGNFTNRATLYKHTLHQSPLLFISSCDINSNYRLLKTAMSLISAHVI